MEGRPLWWPPNSNNFEGCYVALPKDALGAITWQLPSHVALGRLWHAQLMATRSFRLGML